MDIQTTNGLLVASAKKLANLTRQTKCPMPWPTSQQDLWRVPSQTVSSSLEASRSLSASRNLRKAFLPLPYTHLPAPCSLLAHRCAAMLKTSPSSASAALGGSPLQQRIRLGSRVPRFRPVHTRLLRERSCPRNHAQERGIIHPKPAILIHVRQFQLNTEMPSIRNLRDAPPNY